jgi:hypothetical protein
LYSQLSDGTEEVADGGEAGPVEDAKENLWSTLIGLYRLSVLLCIYMKMPLVKEIINMILVSNPDLNQSNIFNRIFSEFKAKNNVRLRKLIMKLLKSKGDAFGDIFNSLQKVIATFSSDVKLDTSMQQNVEVAKQKIRSLFQQILQAAGVGDKLDEAQQTALLEALESKADDATLQEAWVTGGLLTAEELQAVRDTYTKQGLDQMNVSKVVSGLGQTMEKMMAAIQSNDEAAMQEVLQSAGEGLSMDPAQMQQMQEEMERMGEMEDDEDEEFEEDEEKDEAVVEVESGDEQP